MASERPAETPATTERPAAIEAAMFFKYTFFAVAKTSALFEYTFFAVSKVATKFVFAVTKAFFAEEMSVFKMVVITFAMTPV